MTRHMLSETSPESRSIITASTVRRSGNARNVLRVMLFYLTGKLTLRFVVPKCMDVIVVPPSLGASKKSYGELPGNGSSLWWKWCQTWLYGGAASAVGKQDFYARAVSSLDRHGFYGGAASALPHNQFSNNSNTGFNPPATGYFHPWCGQQQSGNGSSLCWKWCQTWRSGGAASALPHNQFGNNSNTGFYPPAASYNLNHSSSKTFEDLVPQPTKPNPGQTNFRMQYSSNQGLLAHNDPTLRSQHNLISLGDMINNNDSPNPGYFQNNTKNTNQAIFTHGAANNNPSGLVRGLPSSSLSWSSVIANGFGQNQNGNLQGRMSSLPVTKNQQGWSSSNILGPHFGNNLSMGGSNMRPFDFPGVKGGIVSNGRNPAPLDTEMKYSYPIHPFGHN
ncbi:hypothetical protein Bca4012_038588 [Brassica carinata]